MGVDKVTEVSRKIVMNSKIAVFKKKRQRRGCHKDIKTNLKFFQWLKLLSNRTEIILDYSTKIK